MTERKKKERMEEFGLLVKTKRQEKRWSLRQLGVWAEIRYPAIHHLEHGGNASLESIVRIVDGLGYKLSLVDKDCDE